ncbi:MAG: TIGR03009 domain-containing protein [Gemmataceae bacterium]|nr:TIGR03009 domain-containing protein [Gemmataceae bacterium]
MDKTITEWKLPDPSTQPHASTDNLMVDFLGGMKAENLKKRFQITLFNEDQYYIYLDIKPLLAKDKEEFKQLRLALYGPRTGALAYLPVQAYIVKSNDTIEQWTISNHKINIAGIDPQKVFRYEDVPGFTRRQAPQSSPPSVPVRPLGSGGAPPASGQPSTGIPPTAAPQSPRPPQR